MPDVLTAADVQEMRGFTFLTVLFNKEEPNAQVRRAMKIIAALARSHEALRSELREAQVSVYDALEMLATARNERDAAVEAGVAHEQRLRADLEASARAAGSATDALREIADTFEIDWHEAQEIARAALAVLGHATPAAEREQT